MVTAYGDITISDGATNGNKSQIQQAEQVLRQHESSINKTISIRYGIFTAALKQGDIHTAIIVLQSCPDLVYNPGICLQLETAITQKLIDSTKIEQVVQDQYDHSFSITSSDLITTLANETKSKHPAPGDIRNLDHIGGDQDQLPAESAASIHRISLLATISHGLGTQLENNSNAEKSNSQQMAENSYQDFITQLSKTINDQTLAARVKHELWYQTPLNSSFTDSYDYSSSRISAFMRTETFSQLPSSCQEQLRMELLGQCLGLARQIAGLDSRDNISQDYLSNRVELLSKVLAPIVTPENTTQSTAINSLPSLESIIIGQIVKTIRDEHYQSGNTLQTQLDTIVQEKSQAAAQAAENDRILQEKEHKQETLATAATEIEGQQQTASQETQRQLELLTQIEQNPTQAALKNKEAGDFMVAVNKMVEQISDNIPVTIKRGLFGIGSRSGYTQDDVDALQAQLNNLPQPDRLNNENRFETEIKRMALKIAIKNLQDHQL